MSKIQGNWPKFHEKSITLAARPRPSSRLVPHSGEKLSNATHDIVCKEQISFKFVKKLFLGFNLGKIEIAQKVCSMEAEKDQSEFFLNFIAIFFKLSRFLSNCRVSRKCRVPKTCQIPKNCSVFKNYRVSRRCRN